MIRQSLLPLPVSLKFPPQERLKKLQHLLICYGHDKGCFTKREIMLMCQCVSGNR